MSRFTIMMRIVVVLTLLVLTWLIALPFLGPAKQQETAFSAAGRSC